MSRRSLSVVLTLAMIHGAAAPALAGARSAAAPQTSAEKMKAEIIRVGIQQGVKMKIDLTDKTSVQGWVDRADEDMFTLTTPDKTRTIAYRDVERAKKAGMSTTKKTLIAIGVGFGLFFAVGRIVGPGTRPLGGR